jgi:hypothetical protein
MVAPALTASTRFIAPETTKIYWVDTIANKNSPTRAELNAGTDVTGEVSDAAGWELAADNVATPDGGSKFTSQVSGRINPPDTSLACYASSDTLDIRDLLARDDAGFIVILHGGDITAQKMTVWPVRVRSVSAPVDFPASAASMINVQFSITSVPAENVAIPA